jgi:hypothetical protein
MAIDSLVAMPVWHLRRAPSVVSILAVLDDLHATSSRSLSEATQSSCLSRHHHLLGQTGCVPFRRGCFCLAEFHRF